MACSRPSRPARHADYLQAEDDILSWISDCCIEDPAARPGASELYDSWKAWAERTGRRGGAGSQKAFSQALEDKGYAKQKTRTANAFLGLRVGRP